MEIGGILEGDALYNSHITLVICLEECLESGWMRFNYISNPILLDVTIGFFMSIPWITHGI